MKKIQLYNSDLFAIVDDEDYDYLSQFRWIKSRRPNNKCTTSRYTGTIKGKATYILMHREIMRAPLGLQVDHTNRNPLDNRKCNLRICTHKENLRNHSPHKSNKTGYKGIIKVSDNKYKCYLTIDGKIRNIGTCKSLIVGALLVDQEAENIFKEFTYLNFPAYKENKEVLKTWLRINEIRLLRASI